MQLLSVWLLQASSPFRMWRKGENDSIPGYNMCHCVVHIGSVRS